MNATYDITPEIDTILSDIETKLNITMDKSVASVLVQVVWKCNDPADAWPLLSSIIDKKNTVIPERVKLQRARFIPVTLRYSDQLNLRFRFISHLRGQTFHALEPYDIDVNNISKIAESGNLVLGDSPESPWKPDDVRQALSLLQEILLDDPDDLCQSIESAVFDAPIERLRGAEILLNPAKILTAPDVLWIIAAPEQFQKNEIDLSSLLSGETKRPVVVPLVGLPGSKLTDSHDYSDPETLQRSLKSADNFLKKIKSADMFPALPLFRNMFFERKRKPDTYERKCFNLAWEVTGAVQTAMSAQPAHLIQRYDNVISAVMQPPESILGLLRQRSYLRMLQPLPKIQASPEIQLPEKAVFTELQREGVLDYSALAQQVVEKAPEKIEPEVKISPFDPVVSEILKFCDQVVEAEYFKNERDDFRKLAGEIQKNKTSPGKTQVKGFVTAVGTLLDSAAKRVTDSGKKLGTQYKDILKIPVPEISAEVLENSGQAQLFLLNILPAKLKKVKIKRPDKTITELCAKTLREFNDFLSLTPDFEEEFKKCGKEIWPASAQKCTEKINNLLSETVNIWQLTLNQELCNLEDFRKEKIPQGPKIGCEVSIKSGKIPVLNESLNVKIKKKPGRLTKLFTAPDEDDSWRKETIESFRKSAKKAVTTYQADVVSWLNTASASVKETIHQRIASAKTDAETEQRKVEALQTKHNAEVSERQRVLAELKRTIATLETHHTNIAKYKQGWNRTKKETIDSILN